MRSTLMGASSALAGGIDKLTFGDLTRGFYRVVPAEEFITPQDLAALVTPLGSAIAANADSPWLKFAHKGKTLYIAQRPHRNGMSWNQLSAAALVSGNRVVTIKGRRYKVRLLDGSNNSPPTDNETRDLMVRVFGPSGPWLQLTAAQLGMASGAAGTWSFTAYEAGGSVHGIGNGNPASAGSIPKSTTGATYGWRPVLELVVD